MTMGTPAITDRGRIRTDGPLRLVYLDDGVYVVGRGLMMPHTNERDAVETLREIKRRGD